MQSSLLLIFEKIVCYLIGLLPLMLITGSFLPDLFICISDIIILFLIIKNKYWKFFLNNFSIFFLIWYLYLVFLSLNSEYILHSFESSLFYFRFGLFSISIWYLLESLNKDLFIKIFIISISFSFIILIIDSFFQFFHGSNLIGFPYNSGRLTSFFGDERILGSYLSRMIPILFAVLFLNYYKLKNFTIFAIIVLILSDIIIYLSGERTAFFYLILFSILVIFLTKKFKILRLSALIVSLIIVFVLSLNFNSVKNRMVNRTIDQIYSGDPNTDEKKVNIFTVQHETIYKTAFKIFKDNIIIGIGPKNFRKVCEKEQYKTFTEQDRSIDGCQAHPHNTYLQLLTETGVIGFLVLFFLFLYINYMFFRHKYLDIIKNIVLYSDYQIFLLIALYISLWPLAPTGNFFHNWLNIIYFMPIGFLLNSYYLKK